MSGFAASLAAMQRAINATLISTAIFFLATPMQNTSRHSSFHLTRKPRPGNHPPHHVVRLLMIR